MSRDWRIYLDDILTSCKKVQRYTKGMTQKEFLSDERTYDAVVRNLEIIGEAAKHIPHDVRKDISGIEWQKVAGLRDILAHDYFGIDNNILWDLISSKVSDLMKAVEAYLKKK